MKMSKYYFKCPDCGRTLTETVPERKRQLFFVTHCPSTIKCGWGGRLKPSEAFDIKTVNVKPGRKVSRKISA
jgi:predicted RNA-binding Zn-ribbon protein involved in translation (DUF1610 family)